MIAPLQQIRRPLDGLVVAEHSYRRAGDFHPAAGCQIFQCLLEEAAVVFHGGFDVVGVDEMERVGVAPVELEVVDFEKAVSGSP